MSEAPQAPRVEKAKQQSPELGTFKPGSNLSKLIYPTVLFRVPRQRMAVANPDGKTYTHGYVEDGTIRVRVEAFSDLPHLAYLVREKGYQCLGVEHFPESGTLPQLKAVIERKLMNGASVDAELSSLRKG